LFYHLSLVAAFIPFVIFIKGKACLAGKDLKNTFVQKRLFMITAMELAFDRKSLFFIENKVAQIKLSLRSIP